MAGKFDIDIVVFLTSIISVGTFLDSYLFKLVPLAFLFTLRFGFLYLL